ncbi:MAG: ribosome maturation factor RimM [Clostridium sp.]
MKEYLVVGQITKAHGLKGEVKVISFTNDPKRFKELKKFFIDGVERNLQSCKLQKDRVILKIEGIDSVEDTVPYKNKYISVHREDALKLEEGEHYIADLIGCNVFDEDGKELGPVYDVLQTGSNDVYWIKDGKEELLIPALESIVTLIDIENSRIVIKPVSEWM